MIVSRGRWRIALAGDRYPVRHAIAQCRVSGGLAWRVSPTSESPHVAVPCHRLPASGFIHFRLSRFPTARRLSYRDPSTQANATPCTCPPRSPNRIFPTLQPTLRPPFPATAMTCPSMRPGHGYVQRRRQHQFHRLANHNLPIPVVPGCSRLHACPRRCSH